MLEFDKNGRRPQQVRKRIGMLNLVKQYSKVVENAPWHHLALFSSSGVKSAFNGIFGVNSLKQSAVKLWYGPQKIIEDLSL